jgi:hypothetical protein
MDLNGILKELKIRRESVRRAIEILEEESRDSTKSGRRPRSLNNIEKMRTIMLQTRFKWAVPRIAKSLDRPVPVVRAYLRAWKSSG